MIDPRLAKLADIMIEYALGIKAGDEIMISGRTLGAPLMLATFERAINAGAHVHLNPRLPGTEERFLRNASEHQLEYVSPLERHVIENFDAILHIGAPENTRTLTGIDPSVQSSHARAQAGLAKTMAERTASGALRWCYTVFPTNAAAQEADMSLLEYEEFVFTAGHLSEADPVGFWQDTGRRQAKQIEWLSGHDEVILKGKNIDMRFSIAGRGFVNACGHFNFPDGEIFTSPIENSANGWVRFSYPALYGGREVSDIELWFEDGRIVREKAAKGADLLTAVLDTDGGSRYLGEWGIGTNYNIRQFTKNILFDEKIGGTIHLAVGSGFPEAGGKNDSGIHWDMLCDMSESEVVVDGVLFYKDGHIVVNS